MDLLLLIDRNSGTPVYRQLVDQIRFQVATGVLAEGAELPSTRTLAAQQGINPMTISKAYAELEREGVLERRLGLNHVVATRAAEREAEAKERALAGLLEPAALGALQLGLGDAEALALYARLLLQARSQTTRSTEEPRR
ncbi:MAG: GntR family transcriptional regulator [Planctomycetaceae bacterium]|nr:GntR family transcriptional regulator [Planctomycetaceae bacterium]